MPLETLHIYIAIGTLFTTGLLAYITIKIKLDIANNNTAINRDHAEIKADLETHIATDEIKHKEIDRHLQFTDGRVDRLESRPPYRARGGSGLSIEDNR